MTKQTHRQRKALRSAAAKKGWETRREKATTPLHDSLMQTNALYRHFVLKEFDPPPPEPTPATPNWLHRLWSWLLKRPA